jgi:hypothetical protein
MTSMDQLPVDTNGQTFVGKLVDDVQHFCISCLHACDPRQSRRTRHGSAAAISNPPSATKAILQGGSLFRGKASGGVHVKSNFQRLAMTKTLHAKYFEINFYKKGHINNIDL